MLHRQIQKMHSTSCSAMDNRPILFFDSGVGGLPYLGDAISRLPNERFVYLADRKNFPYGTKTREEILAAVMEAIERIFERIECKCAVIACNTASVVALSSLREKYSIPFIGVVPAIKPAALRSANKRFGVLATQRTVMDSYLSNLITSFASNCDVHIVPAPQVVDLVEKRFFSATEEEKISVLKNVVRDLAELKVDSVVLGCTHFLHLIKEFKTILGANISLVDSIEGVVNQLARVLEKNHLVSDEKRGDNEFCMTGEPPVEERYAMFAAKYNLKLMGTI